MNKLNKEVILAGYSGHALVCAEVLNQAGYSIKGYLDKEKSLTNYLNINYLGFEDDINVLKKISGMLVFPSIGNNSIRERITTILVKNNISIPNALSTEAHISPCTVFSDGILVSKGASINPKVSIGQGSIINTAAVIEHECIIEDFVHVGPGAVLAGNVKVGRKSFIGANAVIREGINIGENVIIGAGSVVLKDVASNLILVGNPAKIMRK